MAETPPLDHSLLLRLLTYDKRTGQFTWNLNRGRTAKRGDIAGTPMRGVAPKIIIEGHPYQANRLAWFYVYGEWPSARLSWADDNPNNNRWDNIMEEADRFRSQSFSARYQRERLAQRAEEHMRDEGDRILEHMRNAADRDADRMHDDNPQPRRTDRRRRPLERN